MGFVAKLQKTQTETGSVVLVGLDPEVEKLPPHLLHRFVPPEAIRVFCQALIEATHDVVCGYKFNLAFFEAHGAAGWRVLEDVRAAVPPDRLVVMDGKRGDIGNTGRLYAQAMFEGLGCDACTVAPYMGQDSVVPFLQHAGHAAFVLCKTSNPGSADFQELNVGDTLLYEHVAQQVSRWASGVPGTAGLVVGATQPEALRRLRDLLPDAPFLIPGVGAQGGDARTVMELAGRGPVLVNSSRQIIYAASGADFAEAARQQAVKLNEQLGHRPV